MMGERTHKRLVEQRMPDEQLEAIRERVRQFALSKDPDVYGEADRAALLDEVDRLRACIVWLADELDPPQAHIPPGAAAGESEWSIEKAQISDFTPQIDYGLSIEEKPDGEEKG